MSFSQPFFKVLILAALVLMSIGAIALIVMLLKDVKSKKLW
jgi:hypothetical protein